MALNNLKWLMCHKIKTKPNHIYLIYMYKEYVALNNLKWLVCHKSKPVKLHLTNDLVSHLASADEFGMISSIPI